MQPPSLPSKSLSAHTPSGSAATLRSAAVAKMAGMPVATLRIWEQRYGVVQPAQAASKHRFYTAFDVQRIALLRLLTQQGHAIGSIAMLDWAQLQQLSRETSGAPIDMPSSPIRIAVTGQALALRLQRPETMKKLNKVARMMASFESIEALMQASDKPSVDLLLFHAPQLHASAADHTLQALQQAQQAVGANQVVIIYRFAGSRATQLFRKAGMQVIREPAQDADLAAWLKAATAHQPAAELPPHTAVQAMVLPIEPPVPRRYDDAALTAMAGMSPSLACECPTHLAQLLIQLSSFEQYSAGCVNQSPQDAQLHAYLQHTAGWARQMLETALERVALHEGLALAEGFGRPLPTA